MADYTADIQQLYVAYFNRPADYDGLAYWNNQVSTGKATLATVAAAFAADTEYKQTFAGMDNAHIVAQVYLNLFGKTLDKIDTAGFNFWLNALNNKVLTIDNVVTGIAAGAQGADATALKDKVEAATTFTKSLDTVAKQVGYKGPYANAQAKLWLSGIVDDATLKAAIEPAALNATVTKVTTPYIPPVSVALTAGVDTPVFTGGDDTILATSSVGDKNYLTAFDTVDAGAGVDTIKFIDTNTAAAAQFNPVTTGATVSNVEVVSIATTGGVSANTTTWTGVTDVQVTAAGTGANALTVSDTTNVTLASAAAAAATTTVTGGKAVSVALSAATAGDVTVSGAALTNVTVKGGAIASVDNVDAKAVSAKGTTLTSVTLDGVTGATAALKGASLTNVTLKNIAQATTVTVTNATASHALNLTVDAAGKTAAPAAVVTVVDGDATTLNVAAAGASNIALSAAKATKLNVTGEKALTADVTASAKLTTIDASAAKGAVTLTGISNTVTAITGGEGADTLTVTTATVKDNTATTADETVNATVNTNGGDDKVTVNVTGDGKVLLNTGAGNDTVTIAGRGTAVLDVKLGDGNDTFDAAVAINGTDSIDAGAGTDTLALKLVGAANIGAFAGFDVFDAKTLAKTLDVDILAVKNTVSEFVASGDVGAGAILQNIGAGVGFRATADMGAVNAITLTQKTGGALTVTVDADETGTATDAADLYTASVVATNATSLKAVFDTTFLASTAAEKLLALDNQSTLNLLGTAATSLEVVSGGNGSNVLNFDANSKATSVTATGAAALTANIANTKVATFDASGLSGGLTINTGSLVDGGKVILGSGADKVSVAASSTTAAYEGVQGFAKSGAVVVSVDPADATAKAAAIKAADTLVFGVGDMVVANANAAVTTGTIAKGVLTFTGAGPATLADAFAIADAAAETANEVVVFQYLGDSYAFVQGGAADIAVKLVGLTGITQLAEIAPDAFTLI